MKIITVITKWVMGIRNCFSEFRTSKYICKSCGKSDMLPHEVGGHIRGFVCCRCKTINYPIKEGTHRPSYPRDGLYRAIREFQEYVFHDCKVSVASMSLMGRLLCEKFESETGMKLLVEKHCR